MKIVEIIHCPTPGGAEIYVKNLLIHMKRQNNKNEYELWSLHETNELFPNNKDATKFEKEYINELQTNGIKVKTFNRHGSGFGNRLKWYKEIRKYFNEKKPDIIHTHLEIVTFNMYMALLLKKVKIIETIHNEKITHSKAHKFFLNHKLCKIVSIADKVTESVNKNIINKEGKVTQIYNGIEIKKFECKRTFNDEHEINIVAIGRLTEQKNHKLLLEAFKRLTERLEEEHKGLPNLRIYGQGELKEDLIRYIDENNIQNVQLMGITSNVDKVLKESDIYVMSSNYEGFSISLIEAMVSGIAIVCTNVGANNEIIGNNEAGILVASNDTQQLVDALFKLLSKDERKKLYNKCQERKKMFDIKKSAEEHLELYKITMNE